MNEEVDFVGGDSRGAAGLLVGRFRKAPLLVRGWQAKTYSVLVVGEVV